MVIQWILFSMKHLSSSSMLPEYVEASDPNMSLINCNALLMQCAEWQQTLSNQERQIFHQL